MKKCSKCGELKCESEFYNDKRAKDGLYACCKDCQQIMNRRNTRTSEYNQNYQKEYYEKNKDKYKEYHKEYLKEYFNKEENRKSRREYSKNYRQEEEKRIRHLCRATTNRLIKIGELKRENCIICDDIKTEAHHDDYNNPKKVVWLCKKHHEELHSKLNNHFSPLTGGN